MARRGALVPALMLILLGAFFLLINLGVLPALSITQLWPGIVVLVGLTFWGGYFFGRQHDAGLAFVGTLVTLVGAFFFLFTLRIDIPGYGPVDWSDMSRLWPAFPLIVGIAFVVMWLAGRMRDGGILVPAVILLMVGVGGLAFTLGDIPNWRSVLNLWPVMLILLGVGALIQSLRRPRQL
jgi:hypothetical protein